MRQATIGSPRRAMIGLSVTGLSVIGMVAALLLWSGAAPAFAQSPLPRPNPPTNLTTVVGDMEVTVSWSAPETDNPDCPVTRYFLMVIYHPEDSENVVADQVLTSDTMYVMTDLMADMKYTAELYSFGSSCGRYSHTDDIVSGSFTTNASDAPDDPTKPADQPLRSPKRPQDLAISKDDTSLMISWEAADNTGRCSHSHYALRLRNRTDKGIDPKRVYEISGTSHTLEDLVLGDKYKLTVWSYSIDCGTYSPGASKKFTQ